MIDVENLLVHELMTIGEQIMWRV